MRLGRSEIACKRRNFICSKAGALAFLLLVLTAICHCWTDSWLKWLADWLGVTVQHRKPILDTQLTTTNNPVENALYFAMALCCDGHFWYWESLPSPSCEIHLPFERTESGTESHDKYTWGVNSMKEQGINLRTQDHPEQRTGWSMDFGKGHAFSSPKSPCLLAFELARYTAP